MHRCGLFILTPAVLGLLFPKDLVNTFTTGDPFSLLTSITGALWCLFTTLIFVFACWLFFKKRRRSQMGRLAWLLPGLCLLGIVSSLCCALAPFLPTWPALFFSRNRWFPLVVIGLGCSLALAWMMGELPRRAALLRERQKHLEHEKQLRAEVQRLYTHEHDLNQQLNNAYERQRLLLLKQRSLLDEVNRLYHEQEQAARIDAVTGLLNHRAIRERLAEEIEQCCTHAGSFLLFFLDLDHFKNINDTWGHLAGDTILRELAERLRAMLRPEDAAGRYGGEEFLVIKSATPFAEARQEGERLQTSMRAAPWIWQGSGCSPIEIPVTVSIGVAAYGIHGTQPDELIAQADLAMYQAKLAGRNCLRLADRPFLLSGLPS